MVLRGVYSDYWLWCLW